MLGRIVISTMIGGSAAAAISIGFHLSTPLSLLVGLACGGLASLAVIAVFDR